MLDIDGTGRRKKLHYQQFTVSTYNPSCNSHLGWRWLYVFLFEYTHNHNTLSVPKPRVQFMSIHSSARIAICKRVHLFWICPKFHLQESLKCFRGAVSYTELGTYMTKQTRSSNLTDSKGRYFGKGDCCFLTWRREQWKPRNIWCTKRRDPSVVCFQTQPIPCTHVNTSRRKFKYLNKVHQRKDN